METSNQENFKWADRVFQRVIVLPRPHNCWTGPEVWRVDRHGVIGVVQKFRRQNTIGRLKEFRGLNTTWLDCLDSSGLLGWFGNLEG